MSNGTPLIDGNTLHEHPILLQSLSTPTPPRNRQSSKVHRRALSRNGSKSMSWKA